MESQPRLQSKTISILPLSSPSISISSSTLSNNNKENISVIYLFIIVAFSYMIPWTAIGSLIDTYTNKYGKNYYVYLNLAFYGIGYPVSFLQSKVDLYYDVKYGSKVTFYKRLLISLLIVLILLGLLAFVDGILYIIVVIGIGACTWISHGCASTLAGLIKFDSPILQQIGFVLPGLFSILMIYTLDLKGGEVSFEKKLIFFSCACLCTTPGLIAWYFLCHSELALKRLDTKDKKTNVRIVRSAKMNTKWNDLLLRFYSTKLMNQSNQPIPESFTIASDIKNEQALEQERYSYTEGQKIKHLSSSPFHPANQALYLPKENSSRLPPIQKVSSPYNFEVDSEDITKGVTESHSAPQVSFLGDISQPLITPSQKKGPRTSLIKNSTLSPVKEVRNSDSTQNSSNDESTQSISSPLTTSTITTTTTTTTSTLSLTPSSNQSIPLQSVSHPISITKDWTPSLDILAHQIFEQDPSILTTTVDIERILKKNFVHRIALFITMFCSILQSAFFSYMSSVSSNSEITLYLFFIRMFCDLIGRPLALVRPRIIFFRTITGVLVGTLLRAVGMGFFFFYIFTPKDLIYRNDYMILIFQGIYSMLSGYFGSLIYEYSACLYSEESHVIIAAQSLSLIFQQACFTGVIVSAAIALTFQVIM